MTVPLTPLSLSRLVRPWLRSLAATLTLAGSLTLTIPDALAQSRFYTPISLPSSNEITDVLSDLDIPTGQGGYARDYAISLETGDQVAIDLTSDSFDTVVMLLGQGGMTIGENDDGPDGTTNSLLFTRITTQGDYIVRVRSFGEGAGGEFTLKVTRLRPF
ncbi:pre-peptidase C-terminal domain-containing protein [Prochlorothrix hollandica]|uniref:Peptidase n=1 Tax=Prochlorothrix hollandica PCC 9006 = CALU 1027 TaxID=317619 RepID=A0A0M2PT28_PROHO|nr:pre-peptidase C-terminal domain-containing protein [Prochlorothrix hollandica]KKI99289.1 peptidase [Prochlorothrix hollandica PCC 9006 = CALU 1027]